MASCIESGLQDAQLAGSATTAWEYRRSSGQWDTLKARSETNQLLDFLQANRLDAGDIRQISLQSLQLAVSGLDNGDTLAYYFDSVKVYLDGVGLNVLLGRDTLQVNNRTSLPIRRFLPSPKNPILDPAAIWELHLLKADSVIDSLGFALEAEFYIEGTIK